MQTASDHFIGGKNSKVNRQRIIKESLKYSGQIIEHSGLQENIKMLFSRPAYITLSNRLNKITVDISHDS